MPFIGRGGSSPPSDTTETLVSGGQIGADAAVRGRPAVAAARRAWSDRRSRRRGRRGLAPYRWPVANTTDKARAGCRVARTLRPAAPTGDDAAPGRRTRAHEIVAEPGVWRADLQVLHLPSASACRVRGTGSRFRRIRCTCRTDESRRDHRTFRTTQFSASKIGNWVSWPCVQSPHSCEDKVDERSVTRPDHLRDRVVDRELDDQPVSATSGAGPASNAHRLGAEALPPSYRK